MLLKLLAFYSAPTAYIPEDFSTPVTEYHAHLAAHTQVKDHPLKLSRAVLETYRNDALRQLIESMPEEVSPYVDRGTRRGELINLILERESRLEAYGWVPPSASVLRPSGN